MTDAEHDAGFIHSDRRDQQPVSFPDRTGIERGIRLFLKNGD
jgi:hypothetical protein